MIHHSDWKGIESSLSNWLGEISDAYKSGAVAEIIAAEALFAERQQKVDLESEIGAMQFAILDACIGECESLRGRLVGDLVLLKRGINRVEGFVTFIQRHQFGDEALRDRAMCRAKWLLGSLLSRKGYITMDPSDLDRASMTLFEANLLRHSYMGNVRPSLDEIDGDVIPLRARIHRDLADAYVGQLIWDEEVSLDGSAITLASEAVEDFRGICIRGDDSSSGSKGSLDLFEDDRVTEMFASRATLAIALAVTVDRITAERREKARLGAESSGHSLGFFSRKVDVEALHARGVKLVKESYKKILEGLESMDLDEVPHRWARSLSTFGFAAETLWRYQPENDDLFDIARWFFEGALVRYRRSEHPFRRAVNLEGYAGLLSENSAVVGEARIDREAHEDIADKFSEAAELFGRYGHTERKLSCLSGAAMRRQMVASMEKGAGLSVDFKDASIDRIVGDLKPQVPDAAIERLEGILAGAQRKVPENAREFVLNFNSAMDALGLTIRVKGIQGYARLGVSRNSIRLQMNDSGARGFKREELSIERAGFGYDRSKHRQAPLLPDSEPT